MNTVKIRNLEIGKGMPKICVPIVGKTVPEILENAKEVQYRQKPDVVEWRADWYDRCIFVWSVSNMCLRKLCVKLQERFRFYSHSVHCRRAENRQSMRLAYQRTE